VLVVRMIMKHVFTLMKSILPKRRLNRLNWDNKKLKS
jgi:hypothetical protein